ncbi:hypothetical protein BGZ94_002313, partial [Podila epigama]
MRATHAALILLPALAAILAKAELDKNAPSASQLDGIHILYNNDLESTHKPVILLSKKRTYQDSVKACEQLGEKSGFQTTEANNQDLSSVLRMTPVATSEVESSWRYWIKG